MLKFIVSFGAGVYAGVYISQNYQILDSEPLVGKAGPMAATFAPACVTSVVPRVDEPQELWRKVKDFADQYRKSPPGS